MCFSVLLLKGQNSVVLSGVVTDQTNNPISEVIIQGVSDNQITYTDDRGAFTLELPKDNPYQVIFKAINTKLKEEKFSLSSDTSIVVILEVSRAELPTVTIGSDADAFGIRQLRAVEDGGLYVGKKTEVINIDKLVSNKAGNNARQAFAKVPSLNIWESDNAGLQLDIGGRGLSPNRSANFNTRQNGYDMSADALGYPESYYNPPLEAVQQIEVVRGAGALQYGSQFCLLYTSPSPRDRG